MYGNIEKLTEENNYYLKVLSTNVDNQLVIISLKPNEKLKENYSTSQFIKIVKGNGLAIIDGKKYKFYPDSFINISKKSGHEIINTGDEELKLYMIYSLPIHPPELIQYTKNTDNKINRIENLPKNVLFQMALEYNLHELLNFCRISKKINNNVCNNQTFWMKKLSNDYEIYNDIPDKYKLEKGFNYKSYYQYITRKANKYKRKINDLLYVGSKKGDLNLVKLAIKKGASDKKYALRYASENGYLNIVKFLVKSGVDVTADDTYALMKASENGQTDVVKFLIDSGANVHNDYDYALKMASRNGHLEIVKFLVKSEANIHEENDYALRTSSENGHLEIVKFLLSSGANVNADDDYSLSFASRNGHLETVKFLIESGANVNANNDESLRSASGNGHLNTVKYLVISGANVNAENGGALKDASIEGHLDIVKFLVKSGANNINDALNIATKYNENNNDVVEFLRSI